MEQLDKNEEAWLRRNLHGVSSGFLTTVVISDALVALVALVASCGIADGPRAIVLHDTDP